MTTKRRTTKVAPPEDPFLADQTPKYVLQNGNFRPVVYIGRVQRQPNYYVVTTRGEGEAFSVTRVHKSAIFVSPHLPRVAPTDPDDRFGYTVSSTDYPETVLDRATDYEEALSRAKGLLSEVTGPVILRLVPVAKLTATEEAL